MSPLFFALFLCLLSTVHGKDTRHQYPLEDFTARFLHGYRLNFSSSAPHILSSVHGSLRQGHNTFFPNGFSVAPCEIPPFTPLYHGWLNAEPPRSPEWLASTP